MLTIMDCIVCIDAGPAEYGDIEFPPTTDVGNGGAGQG